MARPVFGRRERTTAASVVALDRDRPLVEAARRDPAQFDALYRKYLAQVYAYALYELGDHHAAEDATERMFLRALAALPRFREQARPEDGPEASTFRVWLFRIARNTVANERRDAAAAGPPTSLEAALGRGPRDRRRRRTSRREAVTRDEAAEALRALQRPARRPAPRPDAAVRRRDEHRGDRRRPRPVRGRGPRPDPPRAAAPSRSELGRTARRGDRPPMTARAARTATTAEVDALVADRYLDALLAAGGPPRRRRAGGRRRSTPTLARGRARPAPRRSSASTRRSGSRSGSRAASPTSPRPRRGRPLAAAGGGALIAFPGASQRRRSTPTRSSPRSSAATSTRPTRTPLDRAARQPAARRPLLVGGRAHVRRDLARRRRVGRVARLAPRRPRRRPARRRRPRAPMAPRGPRPAHARRAATARRPTTPASGGPPDAGQVPASSAPAATPAPSTMWTRCPSCEEQLFNKQLEKAMSVCPSCGHHFRLAGAGPPGQLLDEGTFEERDAGPRVRGPARVRRPEGVPGPGRRGAARDGPPRRGRLGLRADRGRRGSRSSSWTSGSWAARWARSSARRSPGPPRRALDERVPLVVVSASGGARMQEGTLALMQLAKTMAALERLRDGRRPVRLGHVRPDDRRRVRLATPRWATSTSPSPTR